MKSSNKSPGTLQQLCVSTKFPRQKIGWNYAILRNENYTSVRNRDILRSLSNICDGVLFAVNVSGAIINVWQDSKHNSEQCRLFDVDNSVAYRYLQGWTMKWGTCKVFHSWWRNCFVIFGIKWVMENNSPDKYGSTKNHDAF